MRTICKECRFYYCETQYTHPESYITYVECKNPDAPLSDYVDSYKDPHKINVTGHCKYFEPIEGWGSDEEKARFLEENQDTDNFLEKK